MNLQADQDVEMQQDKLAGQLEQEVGVYKYPR